jgi:hypothetical protein
MSKQSKSVPQTPDAKQIEHIRRLWLQTEAASGVLKGPLSEEFQAYFRASIFSMSARLEALNSSAKRKSGSHPSSKAMTEHIRQFRRELKLSSQIGYYLFRHCRSRDPE